MNPGHLMPTHRGQALGKRQLGVVLSANAHDQDELVAGETGTENPPGTPRADLSLSWSHLLLILWLPLAAKTMILVGF